jgi:predicted nucleic acid-binding Zn ribbon protein
MMTELLKLLPTIIRNSGESEAAREHAVFAAWLVTVGSQIRQISNPIKLERKTLIVAVLSTTWRTQLRRMRDPLLFKLNSLLGSPVITTIEFVINPDMINAALKKPQEIAFIAPKEHQANLRDQANAIPNPELRDAFLRAAGKCLDRRYR